MGTYFFKYDNINKKQDENIKTIRPTIEKEIINTQTDQKDFEDMFDALNFDDSMEVNTTSDSLKTKKRKCFTCSTHTYYLRNRNSKKYKEN